MSKETKYRLAFSTSGAPGADPRHGGDFLTLAGALTAGWENDASGGRTVGVTYGGLPVMNEEDLRRAFERLRTIESECPDDNKINCAERVLREMELE